MNILTCRQVDSLKMPAPPKGMVWELEVNKRFGGKNIYLWLCEKKRFSGRPNWQRIKRMESVVHPDGPSLYASAHDPTDVIARGVVATANKIVNDIRNANDGHFDELAAELSTLLGIGVKVCDD